MRRELCKSNEEKKLASVFDGTENDLLELIRENVRKEVSLPVPF